MGRQVQISMLPDDVEQLLTHLKSQHRIVVVKRDEQEKALAH